MSGGSSWTAESQRVYERAKEYLAQHPDEGAVEPSDPTPAQGPGRPAVRHSRRAAPGRHSRKCSVCKHPDRDAIEQEYLRWRSPDEIAKAYGVADHSSIYRHAHATGLLARRRTTMRLVLEPIIEQAAVVRVTANAIVNAVRAYARINDQGEWTNPPAVVIHHSAENPNRQIRRLERGLND
ncbi:MAG TPA: hypothetical protein VLY23_02745 [Candidatus Acidoferrum sp.]|nr:hypothetical protein [Candidatus Acidoferrum sp.]